jgi:hypothetical protein
MPYYSIIPIEVIVNLKTSILYRIAFLLTGIFLSLKGLLSFQEPNQLHVTLDGSCSKLNLNKRLGRVITFAQPHNYNRISLSYTAKQTCEQLFLQALTIVSSLLHIHTNEHKIYSNKFSLVSVVTTQFVISLWSSHVISPPSKPESDSPPPPRKYGLIRRKVPNPALSKRFPL